VRRADLAARRGAFRRPRRRALGPAVRRRHARRRVRILSRGNGLRELSLNGRNRMGHRATLIAVVVFAAVACGSSHNSNTEPDASLLGSGGNGFTTGSGGSTGSGGTSSNGTGTGSGSG